MAGRKAPSANAAAAAAAAAEFVPVYEWHDGDGNYVLRLNLPGFKKEEFRVHVDAAARLTVIGQRRADGGGAGNVRLHKVFQLPPTANLDEITGQFDGAVLSLTVPKLPPPGAAELPAKEQAGEDVADKPPPADQKSKVGREAERLIEAARARLAPGRKREELKEQTGKNDKKPPPPAKKVGEVQEEPKPEPSALPTQNVPQRDDQEENRKAAEHKANVEREVERRIEAARARLAAERERVTETKKKGGWKERAEEEGLKLAEAIGNNKEVIATAVAAFAFGLFVSHKLFCRN